MGRWTPPAHPGQGAPRGLTAHLKEPPMAPKEVDTRWSPACPGDRAPPGHQEMGNWTPRRRCTPWSTRRLDSPWPPPRLPEGPPPKRTAPGPPCFDIFITKKKNPNRTRISSPPTHPCAPPRDARSGCGGAGGGPSSTGTPTRSKGTSVEGRGRALWLVPVGLGGRGDTRWWGAYGLEKGAGGGAGMRPRGVGARACMRGHACA